MRSALLLVGLAGVASPALAQPSTLPLVRDHVVVTAALAEEDREELPATATVIAGDEIADRQATTIAELLRTVPGLAVVRSGSPGKVTSLFSRGASSSQTLVLWNGIPLNDPFGGGFDWAFLSTEGVERVEVVRGPFSALYGSDAVGGVVQVLTGRQRGLALRLEGGSDAYRRAAATAGTDLGGLHLDLTGHLRRGDGRVDNDFYDADEAAVRADWAATDSTRLGLLVRSSDAEIGVPYDFFGQPTPDRRQQRRLVSAALPFERQGRRWGVEARVATLATELELVAPDDPFSAGTTDADTDTARTVATFQGSERWWISFGGDWERQHADSVSPFATVDASQRTWAGFGELHWQAGRVSVQAGLRRDDNDVFGAETSAKLGAVVALGGGVRLRGGWGEGFRAPTLVDLYYPGFGNPDLEPERSDSLELGLEGDSGRWRWSLVGFELDQEELIVFDFGTGLPENVGRARSRGAEAEIAYSAGRAHARLAATWLDAENLDTGERLPRRPDESASLVLRYSPAAWTLAAVAGWTGDRVDVGGEELGGYATLDLAASWRAGRTVEPFARVENLLDEDYQEAAGFPAPGRTLVGGLALRF